MKIKELHASERPRERMLSQGAEALGNGELLAIILRNGNRDESAIDLSMKLILMCDGHLSELFNISPSRMMSIPGIGPCKAASVLAAFELGKRFLREESAVLRKPIVNGRMVYDHMLPYLKGLGHEECWLMLLNDSNYIIGKRKLTTGGGSSTVIDPSQAVRYALEKGATGMILIHNHPAGNPNPSKADINMTDRLRKAAGACGIALHDHVIVCDDSFFSFEEGAARSR